MPFSAAIYGQKGAVLLDWNHGRGFIPRWIWIKGAAYRRKEQDGFPSLVRLVKTPCCISARPILFLPEIIGQDGPDRYQVKKAGSQPGSGNGSIRVSSGCMPEEQVAEIVSLFKAFGTGSAGLLAASCLGNALLENEKTHQAVMAFTLANHIQNHVPASRKSGTSNPASQTADTP